MGSWLDKAFPFFVGHRTELSAILMAAANLAKIVANVTGHPLSYEADQAIQEVNGLLVGTGLGFLGAKVARQQATVAPVVSPPTP